MDCVFGERLHYFVMGKIEIDPNTSQNADIYHSLFFMAESLRNMQKSRVLCHLLHKVSFSGF